MTTSNDLLRGHSLLPSKEEIASWPRLYATEQTPTRDKVIYAHFFVGACDWWLAEYDPTDDLAFGYVDLGDSQCAEWGYFDLSQLDDITVQHPAGFRSLVGRDLDWTPRRFREIEEARR